MKTIGFIGLGVMGKSMARNLMKHGFTVHAYARNKSKIEDVISEGAEFFPTIGECVRNCDAVITIVGFPNDVEEVYFNSGNILDSAAPGTYLIDMTTTSPSLSERIYAEGKQRGFHVMDAPVTGGDVGAKNGTLSILVGGDREDFEACLDIFGAMGTNINYQGPCGCGQHAKMANQILIAGSLSGVCEALAYAKAKGLDEQVLLQSVATGAAGSKQLDTYAPRILAGNFAPGFYMKHFNKDMRIVLDEAEKSGLNLNVSKTVYQNCMELQDEGHGEEGNHVLIKYYDR